MTPSNSMFLFCNLLMLAVGAYVFWLDYSQRHKYDKLKTSEIIEIALESGDYAQIGFMCVAIDKILNNSQIVARKHKKKIHQKLCGFPTLVIYLLENRMDTSYKTRVKFYRDFIEELKAKGE